MELTRNRYTRRNLEVIGVAQYDYIRYLHFNEHLSARAIAKKVGVHRNTVKRAIQYPEQKYRLTNGRPQPVNGPFAERIRFMVKGNRKEKRKKRLTKRRMFHLLKEEGYTGKYSAFTEMVRKIEKETYTGVDDAFIELVPLKGSLQVDFGEMTVKENGTFRKVFAFCAKLCWAKGEFVKTYPGESTEFFFDGLKSAFEFYGGIPFTVIFDNLTPAVKKILLEDDRELQPEFLKFKSFYCFDAVFCGAGKPNEKGLVENLVKYVRNNYFLPAPTFEDFISFNESLLAQCIKRNDEGTLGGKSFNERLKEEKFLPLGEAYDCSRLITAKVDTYQRLHIERNRYSVPTRYVKQWVQVRISPFIVEISDGKEIIAAHTRLFGKDKDSLNPYHYLDILQIKARAYAQAKVIQDWHLPDIYELYRKRLQGHLHSNSKGTREFIDILKLTKDYGIDDIASILTDLDAKNRYGYQEVLSELRCRTEHPGGVCRLPDEVLSMLNIGHIQSAFLPLSRYDELLERREVAV
jgi:transposase